ncbi:MAG: hypothetical protein JETCAE03_36950 [Ignavibacteriaceae bacterium]|nr:MAG: hypothetical protein JETCAE03_36950 [Ignavibacteriaceae bacterium]
MIFIRNSPGNFSKVLLELIIFERKLEKIMKPYSLTSKILLIFTFASGTLWLGSYTVKLFSFFNLFDLDPNNSLILKSTLINVDMKPVIFELLPVLTISLSSYIIFIASGLLFLFISKVNLKENGWLFIILMIVLFCLPFEIYLSLKDYKLIMMIINNTSDSSGMVEIIKSRITVLSSFPIVALILHYSLFILVVFRPLTKKNLK